MYIIGISLRLMCFIRQMTGGQIVICPVDSIITEQRISHLSAYSRSGAALFLEIMPPVLRSMLNVHSVL